MSYENTNIKKTARRSKKASSFAKRIITILDNIVMLLQREFEAKQQLCPQMIRKKIKFNAKVWRVPFSAKSVAFARDFVD